MGEKGEVERQTYSIPEFAARAGISRNSAYLAARNGEIPVVKIGGRLLVPRAAADRLLAGEAVER